MNTRSRPKNRPMRKEARTVRPTFICYLVKAVLHSLPLGWASASGLLEDVYVLQKDLG